jgi:hypothetical protein
MTVWTVPRRAGLRSVAEDATVAPNFNFHRCLVTGSAPLIDNQTPSPRPFADVVVASDREVTELVSRSLAENADVWRRLADL